MGSYERQNDLIALHSLSHKVQRVKELETAEKSYRERLSELEAKARNAKSTFDELPTKKHSSLKKMIDDRIEKAAIRKRRILQSILVGMILLLGAACALLFYTSPNISFELGGVHIQLGEIAIVSFVFTAIMTIAMAIYAVIEINWPYSGIGEWISIGGFFVFCFCIWAPFLSVVVCALFLSAIRDVYAAIPVAMTVLMIAGRLVRRINFKLRDYTEREKKELADAKSEDQSNLMMNNLRKAKAQDSVRQQHRGSVTALNRDLQNATEELRKLHREIRYNGMLSETDVPYVDRIAWFLESGRADSIKEALHLLDQERAVQAKFAWDQYNRRNQELDNRWNRDQMEAQRASDRAAAQYHREKLEEKLDEIESDIKYYNKYGWDKA